MAICDLPLMLASKWPGSRCQPVGEIEALVIRFDPQMDRYAAGDGDGFRELSTAAKVIALVK